jgi:hypothetical protein
MGGRGIGEAIPGAHTEKFWFDVQRHIMVHDRLTRHDFSRCGYFRTWIMPSHYV